MSSQESAGERAGGDPLEVYQPWIFMDSLQQSLLLLHQVIWLSAIVVVVLERCLGTVGSLKSFSEARKAHIHEPEDHDVTKQVVK